MELRQLRYAVAVAEHRSFRGAAAAMYVAQPAISQQIARLERELGLRIFDRSPHHVAVTAAGERFLVAAQRVLTAADEARELADELSSAAHGLLHVGTTGGLGARLGAILARVRHDQPGLRVLLEAAHTPAKLAKVRSGELDAAFVREPGDVADLEITPLWRDGLAVLLPSTSPLAQRKRIPLTELATLRVMLPDRQTSPGVHGLIAGYFRREGVTLRPAPSRGGAQETFAEVGFGHDLAAVVYASTLGSIEAQAPPGVTARPLAGRGLTVGCSIASRAGPSAAVRAFVAAARAESAS